ELIRAQLFERAESIQAGHLHIEEKQVGAMLTHNLNGIRTVCCFRYDFDVVLAGEQCPNAFAGEGLIVGNYGLHTHAVWNGIVTVTVSPCFDEFSWRAFVFPYNCCRRARVVERPTPSFRGAPAGRP